ncbi:MAG: LysR family transcriptional regulator [Paracoccus sp. (in: a-proteobacteria)]|uniref:LysR family transcriptional regulator n=1 Tax=Paracoccus sp. TaxID=267 RepID=UPI0026DEBE1F|nr:LysR family transcriptional regulator [Paracoccus sp. (in: a-proteobacteria)]MDO5630232.1 LysR family transcriptional regulator [Paracoccus sp. (in: a-proteobacteria)]
MSQADGLELVSSFLAVADELNFRRAAQRLNLDQSALTRRIQKLEHYLGFRLLERTTREVTLTQAGHSFFRDNTHLTARYRDSVLTAQRIAAGKTGVLRVAYMAFAATELMPASIARFRRNYPDVDVQLQYIRTQGQKLALANGDIDIGYMIGPFDHPEFHSMLLSDERLYLVTPRTHPLLNRDVIRPRDLADVPVILGDMQEWGEYRWRLSDLFHSEGVNLNVVLEASNTLALIGLVAAGMGVTVYPESLIGFLGRSVEVRPIMNAGFRISTILVWKRSNASIQLREFIDCARHVS